MRISVLDSENRVNIGSFNSLTLFTPLGFGNHINLFQINNSVMRHKSPKNYKELSWLFINETQRNILLWRCLWIAGNLHETPPQPCFQTSARETADGLETQWSSACPCPWSGTKQKTWSTYYNVVVFHSVCWSWEWVCVHHNVRRLGAGGVEADVQRLDLDLHWGRGVDEDPAAVVRVGGCWILKDSAWRKQLNVTICWARRFKGEPASEGARFQTNVLGFSPWCWLLFVFFFDL